MSLTPLSSQPGSSVTPTVVVDPTDPTRTLKINADGSLNTSGGGTGGSSDVAIHDNTTTTYHLKVNADGSINTAVTSGGGGVASSVALNDGTTTTQKLAIDASGKLGVNNFPATQPVSGTVAVSNFPAASSTVTIADPTTGTQKLAIDATGKIGINNLPATQPISGSVSVSNFPATQPVSGSVSVSNLSAEQAVNVNQVNGAALSAGNPIFTSVQNFPATQPVSGSISVSNLSAEQAVNVNQVNGAALSAANPVFTSVQNFPSSQTVAGSVSVSNLPATQAVSGSINLADPTTPAYKLKINSDGSINITGGGGSSGSTVVTDGTTLTQKLAVDATGKIGINNLPATQPVSGAVSVSNFPATQAVSGSVSVSNLTAEQATNLNQVNGATLSAANPVFTSVQNFPATQAVSGSVSVSNLPATQPVSGSVSVSNLPTTQPISGSLTIADPTTGTQKLAVDAAGKIGVNNFPTTQAVSGSVSVSNFPATQPVSGSVSLAAGSALVGGVNLIDSAGTNKAAIDASGNISVKQGVALPAGSALIGGTNLVDSAGTNKAAVDASGNLAVKQVGALPAGTNLVGGVNVVDSAGTYKLKVNSDGSINTVGGGGGSSVLATQDGLGHATVPETVMGAYLSGGPVITGGVPSGFDVDRVRTVLGKYLKSVTITATAAGDTSLTCAAGVMATVMPGQLVRLGAANACEYVIVSTSYTPAAGLTSIPLQSPVVTAGRTAAAYDAFNPNIPLNGGVLPTGVVMQMPVYLDGSTGNMYPPPTSSTDNIQPTTVPLTTMAFIEPASGQVYRNFGRWGAAEVAFGGRFTSVIAAGVSGNTVVRGSPCRLGQVLVTAVGTNALYFYDNASTASGTIVAIIPTTATLGQLFTLQMPCANGLTTLGNAANPAVTLTFSY